MITLLEFQKKNKYLCSRKTDSVAQLVEQRPFKPWVLSSSLSGITKKPQKCGFFIVDSVFCVVNMDLKRIKYYIAEARSLSRVFHLTQYKLRRGKPQRDHKKAAEMRLFSLPIRH